MSGTDFMYLEMRELMAGRAWGTCEHCHKGVRRTMVVTGFQPDPHDCPHNRDVDSVVE